MSDTPSNHFDIAVIGLGPVGSLGALLFAEAGLRVVAIEKDTEVYRLPRALSRRRDHSRVTTVEPGRNCNDAAGYERMNALALLTPSEIGFSAVDLLPWAAMAGNRRICLINQSWKAFFAQLFKRTQT